MFSIKFHEKWAFPFWVLLIWSYQISAQCPQTQSVSFGMQPNGIPTLDRLQPEDFYVNPADTSVYEQVSLSRDLFQCIDLGVQRITIAGLDSQGLPFSCSEFVWVYDSVLLCSPEISTNRAIGGKIFTEDFRPLSNVTVALSGMDINYFRGTDEGGLFLFEDFEGDSYNILPNTPLGEVRNGISTLDVLLLQKHILGLRRLDSPYKLLAADLNNSNSLTAFDMVLLRQMILSIIDEFPDTPSWKFIRADFEFSDPQNPFADVVPDQISLSNNNNQFPSLDNRFVAIKMGDMNNSVSLDSYAGNRARVEPQKIFIESNLTKEQQFYTLSLESTTSAIVSGIQFALEFDETVFEFSELIGLLPFEASHYSVEEGIFRVSWSQPNEILLQEGEIFLELTFIAKSPVSSDLLPKLSATYLTPELYLSNGATRTIELATLSPEHTSLQVYQNFPNPFSTTTNIPFFLPTEGLVRLDIFDKGGRLIWRTESFFNKGQNHFSLSRSLPASGVYFYQLESASGVVTKKMNYELY